MLCSSSCCHESGTALRVGFGCLAENSATSLQMELLADFSFEFFYLPYIPENNRQYNIIYIHYNRTLFDMFWIYDSIRWKHIPGWQVCHCNTYYIDFGTIDLAPKSPWCLFSSGTSRCTMRKLIVTTSTKKSKVFPKQLWHSTQYSNTTGR